MPYQLRESRRRELEKMKGFIEQLLKEVPFKVLSAKTETAGTEHGRKTTTFTIEYV